MNRRSQQTYHLYHHFPEPLPPQELDDRAWLMNNGVHYRLVATLQARTPEEAYQAVRQKMTGQGKRSRCVTLHSENGLWATEPGDVLLDEEAAWMIISDTQIRPIVCPADVPWKSYRHDGTIWCVRWAPEGTAVAAIGHMVSLHTPGRTDEHVSTPSYRRHRYTSHAVAWSPDGKHIASGGQEGEVHIWKPEPFGGYANAAKGSILMCWSEATHHRYASVTALAWAPDSTTLLAAIDRDIVRWDARTGEQLQLFERHHGEITALLYSPDGSCLASASHDGTLRLWREEDSPDDDTMIDHGEPVTSVAWSPDGLLLVSACTNGDRFVQFWDAITGKAGERFPVSISSTQPLTILTLAWSPNGRYVAAGCDDGTVQIVDVALRKQIRTYRSEDMRKVHSLSWSPDGTTLAAGGARRWSSGGIVELWQWPPSDE